MVIGVDIDGVLGDQIAGIIPRVAEEFGITLTFEMINDWRFSFGPSDIANEIAKAQASCEYIENMPVFHGAREMLAELGSDHGIVIITARPPGTQESTEKWLERERLYRDQLVFAST